MPNKDATAGLFESKDGIWSGKVQEGLLQNKILKNQAKEKVSENRLNSGSH